MRTRLVIELALAVGLSLRPANAVAQGAPGGQGPQGAKCAALSSLQVPGFALAITRTDSVAAGPALKTCVDSSSARPANTTGTPLTT